MRIKNLLCCLTLAGFMVACSDEAENLPMNKPLQISVSADGCLARNMIEENVLPAGSSIGVKLTDSKGLSYDGINTGVYDNMSYTSSDGLNWNTNVVPMLSSTDASLVAYYPFSAIVQDYKNIDVDAVGQIDYMYSGLITEYNSNAINNANPKAEFSLHHAMSAVKLSLTKSPEFMADAKVSKITVQSPAFGVKGKMDATLSGSYNLKNVKGNVPFTRDKLNITLTQKPHIEEFILIPTNIGGSIKITVTVNGVDYMVNSGVVTLKQGEFYNYNLTLKPTKASLSAVGVENWGKGGSDESLDLQQ